MRNGRLRGPLPYLALIVFVALAVTACVPGGAPVGSGGVTPEPTALVPAQPGADPISLLAWLFTPIFQGLFILLAALYKLTGDVGIAIILMTLIIRAVMIP